MDAMMNALLRAKKWILALPLLAATAVSADTLWLSNGDKISGELLSVTDGQLTWSSPLFGEITVSQLDVAFLDTEAAFNMAVGSKDPMRDCVFTRKEDQQWVSCDGKEQALPPWQGIDQIASGELIDKAAYQMTGSVAIALNDSGGNTDEQEIGIDVRTQVRNDKNRHGLSVDIDIKETDGAQTKDQQTYRYKYDRFVTEQWFWSLNAGLEKDDFKDMEERRTVDTGIGYQFLDTEFVSLSVEGGLSYIEESFVDGSDDEKGAFRWSTDYRWQILSSGLTFFHRNLLWQTFESGNDWEIETESGFLVPIIGSLSSEFKYEYDYDNTPAAGDEKADRVWTVGVRYDW
jgi:putative salt-induced outer membrane protein YdiY